MVYSEENTVAFLGLGETIRTSRCSEVLSAIQDSRCNHLILAAITYFPTSAP